MAAGLGALRLEPRAFWSMTLKELAAALRSLAQPASRAPPGRTELAALMAQFPDRA